MAKLVAKRVKEINVPISKYVNRPNNSYDKALKRCGLIDTT